MDQGHDDAASAGATGGNSGNNSAEQFQPEPQAPQTSDLGAGASAPTQPADSPQLNAAPQTTPQGIFSSPDLAVNSENLEDIKPELSDENKSRIASAFAMTDATQKHDQLADQMASQDQDAVSGTVLPAGVGGFGSNSTASTATGDIRMPGAKKKSKLPLILLALVVLAAVGGGVAWMLLGKSNTPTVSTSPLAEAEKSFAKYANYLLYGEDKDTFDGEYDSTKSYLLNEKLNADSYDEIYWNKASELLDQSAGALGNSDIPEKSQLMNALDNYRQNFNFVKFYDRVGSPDSNALLGTLTTSGIDGVNSALNEFYKDFSLLGSNMANTYAEQRKQQYYNMVQLYAVYGELGCIQDGVVNETLCAAPSVEQQQRIMDLSVALSRSAQAADLIASNAINLVESYCWDFNGWLKDPATLEGDTDEPAE